MDNDERNSFTYADLYSDCFRYLNINNPKTIRKMTLTEYNALRRGSMMRMLDDMELRYDTAFKTALSGAFDKNGKPIVKSTKDLFDRQKLERDLLRDFGKSKVTSEHVERFKKSKELAEMAINDISFEINEKGGNEDVINV